MKGAPVWLTPISHGRQGTRDMDRIWYAIGSWMTMWIWDDRWRQYSIEMSAVSRRRLEPLRDKRGHIMGLGLERTEKKGYRNPFKHKIDSSAIHT